MLADTLAAIVPVDDALAPAVQTRLDNLTKPPAAWVVSNRWSSSLPV